MPPHLEIRDLDTSSRPERAAVAAMHAELLVNSPIVLLGERFLRDYYYGLLPSGGLIRAKLATVDGKPAAFTAYTADPNGFMRAAILRWWYRLAWVLGVSLIERPSRFGALWEAVRIMATRGEETAVPEGTGEILSLGVLPEFTDPGFVQSSGLRIARDLIQLAVDDLADLGDSRVMAIIDADNRIAQMMYHGFGWRLTRKEVPGWRVPSVEFAWDGDAKS
jgi:ribosomal protein S18 acetylase RimI-like enzyme